MPLEGVTGEENHEECTCPECQPEKYDEDHDDAGSGSEYIPKSFTKSHNVFGHIKVEPGSEIEEAQVKCKGGAYHGQYRVKGITGYYSFDGQIEKGKAPAIAAYTSESYAGSGAGYFKVEAYKYKNTDKWILYYANTGLMITIDITTNHVYPNPTDWSVPNGETEKEAEE